MINDTHKMGPIYFGVALWGRPFCESFINYALASLLAEGNIPALDNPTGKNRFLIYTTAQDKFWLETQDILKQLKNFMELEFLEMLPISEDEYQKLNNPLKSSKLYTMTQGHRTILSRMYKDKATGSIVLPDSIYANQSIHAAYQYILRGKTATLAFCPRFSTTSLTEELVKQKYAQPGIPLTIKSRALIKAAMSHLHTDTLMQQWDAPYLPEFILDVGWSLSEKGNMLFHSCSSWPVFVNYGCLASHNLNSLGNNTMDGVYLHDNIKKEEAHLITNSDEFTLISFSPEISRKLTPVSINGRSPPKKILNLLKMYFIKKKIKDSLYLQTDPFKLAFAGQPIFVHSEELTPRCLEQQKEAQITIDKILRNRSTIFERVILRMNEEEFNISKMTQRVIKKIKSEFQKRNKR